MTTYLQSGQAKTKILLLFSLLSLGLASCNLQTKQTQKDTTAVSKTQDSIDKFWKWFQANEKSLHNFQENPDKTLAQVLDSVKQIESGLAIEFEPPKNDIINVTVSADGNKNLFPLVKEIVAKAPAIEGWTFIAFRQRMSPEKIKKMILEVQDRKLYPDKMKFFPVVSGDSLDIIVYTKDITEENYAQIAYGGLLLLDNILGEYDCVTKVRKYDFQNMPTSQQELKDLKPLLELPEYIDNFHKKGKQ